jgi:hypothetical protein
MRAIWLSSVRWLVENRMYVPSGLQSSEPALAFAKKLIGRAAPPAAGATETFVYERVSGE